LQRIVYGSFAELFPAMSISLATWSSSTLEGIDPPESILLKDALMLWPDGRTVAFTLRLAK